MVGRHLEATAHYLAKILDFRIFALPRALCTGKLLSDFGGLSDFQWFFTYFHVFTRTKRVNTIETAVPCEPFVVQKYFPSARAHRAPARSARALPASIKKVENSGLGRRQQPRRWPHRALLGTTRASRGMPHYLPEPYQRQKKSKHARNRNARQLGSVLHDCFLHFRRGPTWAAVVCNAQGPLSDVISCPPHLNNLSAHHVHTLGQP